ncbi:hypothetical protein V2J09_017298 [Rumex salicifolius]
MDLLCNAYSNVSDDEDSYSDHSNRPTKRPKPEVTPPIPIPGPISRSIPPSNPQTGAPVPGRYVSKRERALMASIPDSSSNSSSVAPISSVLGSISTSDLPRNMLLLLREAKGHASNGKLPELFSQSLSGHKKPVNSIQWSRNHAHLLASAGMDNSVCIWNVWSNGHKKARVLNYHNAAVKDVRWSQQGQFILSCGYDCASRLIDIEKGVEAQSFIDDQAVTAIKFHPGNSNLFLSGGLKGILKLWDIRAGKTVHQYIRRLGPILDVEFMNDGTQFISSSDESRSNASENTIIVWNIDREVPLSNQVYAEAYTCPSIICHPSEPFFVAQSNGNYIAIFSTKHPFRLDKYKRFESHGVFGFPIKSDFSLDGKILVSGSAEGSIYLYDVKSSKLIKKVNAFNEACVDVAFHPLLPNVIASCSWGGDISVFEQMVT